MTFPHCPRRAAATTRYRPSHPKPAPPCHASPRAPLQGTGLAAWLRASRHVSSGPRRPSYVGFAGAGAPGGVRAGRQLLMYLVRRGSGWAQGGRAPGMGGGSMCCLGGSEQRSVQRSMRLSAGSVLSPPASVSSTHRFCQIDFAGSTHPRLFFFSLPTPAATAAQPNRSCRRWCTGRSEVGSSAPRTCIWSGVGERGRAGKACTKWRRVSFFFFCHSTKIGSSKLEGGALRVRGSPTRPARRARQALPHHVHCSSQV